MSVQELKHSVDAYNCVLIDVGNLPTPQVENFAQLLKDSVQVWGEVQGRKAVKLHIPTAQSPLIPSAVELGFEFHHAQPGYACLTRIFKGVLPRYPFLSVGAGALLINRDEVLLIREKTGPYMGWKLPGGYLDPHEKILDAATRELREETGISESEIEIDGILTFRHLLQFKWQNTGDLYFVVLMHVKETGKKVETVPCPVEIQEISWKQISEVLQGKIEVSKITEVALGKFQEWKKGNKSLLTVEDFGERNGFPAYLYS